MPKLVLANMPPYDGEYEFDTERALNAREWRWIKVLSGHTPSTFNNGLADVDPDLYIAVSVIAMCRQGRIGRDEFQTVADELSEMPFSLASITLVGDEVEEPDEVPLDLTPTPVGLLRGDLSSSVG